MSRIGPLVTLAATTGLRQGELLGLAWADVDMAAATLTVRQRHGARRGTAGPWARSRRHGAVGPSTCPRVAVDALEAQREAQEAARTAAGADWQDVDGLVFTDALGRPLQGWQRVPGL